MDGKTWVCLLIGVAIGYLVLPMVLSLVGGKRGNM